MRNRIVGHGEEDPEQLLAHPDNFRIHTRAQQSLTESAMSRVGWVDDVTVNQTTGRVLDGHMRIAIAMRRGEKKVPVKYVELLPAEEQYVLRTFDPLGELAMIDQEKLASLHNEVVGLVTDGAFEGDPSEFAEMLEGLSSEQDFDPGTKSSEEPEKKEEPIRYLDCPHCKSPFIFDRSLLRT